MTNDGWGSKWPSGDITPIKENWVTDKYFKEASKLNPISQPVLFGPTPEFTDWPVVSWQEPTNADVYEGKISLDTIKQLKSQGFNDPAVSKAIGDLVEANYDTSKFKSQGSNLVDEQAYLYFQCDGCQDILDPHTKSFAKLQEHRVNAGWHVKWNIDGMGYKVYCAKCGEKV